MLGVDETKEGGLVEKGDLPEYNFRQLMLAAQSWQAVTVSAQRQAVNRFDPVNQLTGTHAGPKQVKSGIKWVTKEPDWAG